MGAVFLIYLVYAFNKFLIKNDPTLLTQEEYDRIKRENSPRTADQKSIGRD